MSVGKELRAVLGDLGGSLNEGQSAAELQDNEHTLLENFYQFGGKLRTRAGRREIASPAVADVMTTLAAYKLAVGDWLLIAGTTARFLKQSGQQLVLIPLADAPASGYASSFHPWWFRQYKDIVLAARKETGTLKRITPDFAQNAGIVGPSGAPTIADGGAGAKGAGDYYPVYTFYNRDTTVESNPSPVGAKVTLGANKRLTWTNVGISTNGQVNARRLYLTLANQQGEYYFVKQIEDNFTTGPIDDNVIEADLGRQVSFDNGLPPAIVNAIEVWNDRLFTTDGKEVAFSQLGLTECFSEFSVIPVYPDDGHQIRGLTAWGDRLAIPKTNAVHYLLGAGPSRFELRTLTDKHGCASGHSMKTAEGGLFWYSGENVYLSEGVGARSITTVKIRRTLDLIPDDSKEFVTAEIWPQLSQYRLLIDTGSGRNDLVLVYNYKTDSWTTYKYPYAVGGIHPFTAYAPRYMTRFFDEGYGEVLYAINYGNKVDELEFGTDDAGLDIVAKQRGKGLGYGEAGLQKAVRRIQVLTPALSGAVMTARAYNDLDTSVAIADRSFSLSGKGWKRARLSTLGKLAALHQIELEYSGRQRLDIEGIIIEGVGFQRQGKVL